MNTTRRTTSTWLFIFLVIVLVFLMSYSLWSLASTTDFGESDFMIYWSAGYLVRQGANPYNIELIRAVQQAQPHWKPDVTTIAWNPPFLFVFLLPLTLLPFLTAKFAWLVISILLVLTAGIMLIRIYLQAAASRVRLAFLMLGIGFPAVMTGLYMGQVTFLVFWGLVASLYLIKKEQWFWSGAALILTTIKPHIVILAVIYILFYMAWNRKYQGWLGLAVAGVVCLAILLLLCPTIIKNLVGETSVASGHWATSTIGGVLSYLGISELANYLFVLFLPLAFLFAMRSEKFSVEFSIALLTLITIPTTFYGWSYDQTILLIPIALLFRWLVEARYKLAISAGIVCILLLNYYQRGLPLNEVYYAWIPLAWCLIFALTWFDVSSLKKKTSLI